MELETQLDAAMRSRRVGTPRSDTQITSAQLQALELHNTNLQVSVCIACFMSAYCFFLVRRAKLGLDGLDSNVFMYSAHLWWNAQHYLLNI